jgi:putative ABC transport system ATP-binding protein
MNVIEVDGITKAYRSGPATIDVLRSVTCRIESGEIVAIMGASGSGKSTLLNILGFLDRPDGGTYRFAAVDYSNADDDTLSSLRNRRIGFVFQQFHLLERVSALRNVMLPLLYADDDTGDGEARAMRALESVGLASRAGHLPTELSGGEQQRVAIARALINDPLLVLADEPTGNLDVASAGDILDVLEQLRGAGRAIVIATHDHSVARRADRTLLLANGRLEARPLVGT